MERTVSLSRRIHSLKIASTRLMKKPLTRLKLRRRGSFAGCTWISLAIRPLLERDWFKSRLIAPLLAVMAAAVIPYTRSADALTSWSVGEPLPEVMTIDLVIPSQATQTTSLIPVTNLIGISQTFHAGHRGLDLRAPLNSPVVAMRAGKVIAVDQSSLGYGHHLYIEHNAYLITMYAHVNHIFVRPGDLVDAGDQVADIGLTGWSTGPHLHFEAYQEGTPVNPIAYLKPELNRLSVSLTPAPSATAPAVPADH